MSEKIGRGREAYEEEWKDKVEKENRKTMSTRTLIRGLFSWRRILKLGRKKLVRDNP